MSDTGFESTLSRSIFEFIVFWETSQEDELNETMQNKFNTLVTRAFHTLEYDFVNEVLHHMELQDYDLDVILKYSQLFDALATLYIDDTHNHQLIAVPFLAAGSYGLPFGQFPKAMLRQVYDTLKKALPESFDIRLNTDIVNTEHFLKSPKLMHAWLQGCVASHEPGICTFAASDETAEEINNLVADIRVLLFIVSAPINQSEEPLDHDLISTDRLKKRLEKIMRRHLQKQYLATRFEFSLHHSDAMSQYLFNVAHDEVYLETLWIAPPFALIEAGKLFRHFSLQACVSNLCQTMDLTVSDLRATVGAFFEMPSPGCLSLTEYRIGIARLEDEDQVLQGTSWPLFFSSADTAQHVLNEALLHVGFTKNNIKALRTVFPIDEDEELLEFPTPEGELKEPTAPEMPLNIPSIYTLN